MKQLYILPIAILCLIASLQPLYATEKDIAQPASDAEGMSEATRPTEKADQRYTFGDFFDALDLPTVVGGSFCPNGIEGGAFNSAMRLGWRHHKNYGTYAFIAYDAHSRTYKDLQLDGTNVTSGEVWYHTISLGVGYRIPLVRDIKGFYEQPYFHPWDFFFAVDPGLNIAIVKDVQGNSGTSYTLTDHTTYIPTLRFSGGVEWFIFHNFGIFAEVAYTQHLMPSIIERAAIAQGMIERPSGSMTFSVGLSLFFN